MSGPRGCAGVALTGELVDDFAPLLADPLARARVSLRDDLTEAVAGVTVEHLWSLDADAAVKWSLSRRTVDDALVFCVDGEPALIADLAGGLIELGEHAAGVAAQLVAAVGAPALATARGAVPVHGSAAAGPSGATVLVGASGAGKSSLLCALADAGWQPIAEDVTVLDVAAGGAVRAWPGPPWVRLAPGVPGPAGSVLRADATDKGCWDLTGRMPEGPTPVERIVVVAPPGGDDVRLEPLRPDAAIAALPPHVAWLSALPRADAVFTAAVALSRGAPVVRLQVPRRSDWAEIATAALSEV